MTDRVLSATETDRSNMNGTLSERDWALIDRHFESRGLSRSYSPAGIYRIVQRFIDTELDVARARHDEQCELNSVRRFCDCAHRRDPENEPRVLRPA